MELLLHLEAPSEISPRIAFDIDVPLGHRVIAHGNVAFKITYPLETEFVSAAHRETWTLQDVFDYTAKVYKEIIYTHQGAIDFGIWGHDIIDLFFEGITVSDDGRVITPIIGS